MDKKKLEINQILSLAVENHRINNFKLAESLYRKILKKDANHFQSIFLLGTLLSQVKNFNESVIMLSKAIQIQPNHADSFHNLGSALIELGQFKKAINLLIRVTEINPSHLDVYYNLGNAFKQLKDFQKAKEYYEKEIEIQPKNAKAYNNLGNVLKELGNLQKAINSYRQTIQIQPNHARAYHNLGNVLKQLGDFKKAKNSYQKAFQYQPSNLETLDALSGLDKEILDPNLKSKINEILKNKNLTKKDVAYGNFLLSKYEFQQENYENEFNYLLKGHSYYFEFKKKSFEKGVDYWLKQLPKINELMNMGLSNKNIKKIDYKIKPIFIVGVPRCGSTLIEKIIASGINKIPIGEETAILSFFVGEYITEKQLFNQNMTSLRKKIIDMYKQKELIQEKANYIFTDKSLDNFFFIGLIKEFFPLAKVINCQRNALSSIISILKNNLGDVSWAHNLEHIFQYFDIYYQKIEDFKKIFPNYIYELQLEKFVGNPEIESQKLMKFCNLPWDKKCLEFYKRKDLISRTASNIQIRKAIYNDSEKRNLPYKQFLNKYGDKYHWFN